MTATEKHSGLTIIYAGESFPTEMRKAIFLAGPTPRRDKHGILTARSWRIPDAITILEELGYDGHVFLPEDRPGSATASDFDYHDNYAWETGALHRSDVIVFWVPRALKTMPAFTTNVEFGEWFKSGKVIYGAPKDPTVPDQDLPLPKNKYLEMKADEYRVPRFRSLRETLATAVSTVGAGALRKDAECEVPLPIWSSRPFRAWYENLKARGNTLKGVQIHWHRSSYTGRVVMGWVMDAKVWVASEKRIKTADTIISRLDISAVMLWKKDGRDILSSPVVLVKEFRSSARTPDGFIHELPSGATIKEGVSPQEGAREETHEETGIDFELSRFRDHGSRQLAGTFSAHHAHLFSVALTDREYERYLSQQGVMHGNPSESERCYIEIVPIRRIIDEKLVDWTTMGMILQVVADSSQT
ncbi:MAG: hypothetical protein A3I44_02295 [Candidatus Sungbacteria bacterium RIFCSPLOWO2_02_FULL_51_17]|nr:MAG: hypothetical protein A2676_01970 [Candidatus Sungbacteria bacterium RIFCSPHIGHO2_01_FULL_51_22]OHA04762.1 MAG: hypothetical protein A3B29_01490 [Candidatus Sungbacteria bacterium RIFCSPLOWO2_01_FULL_51_34]OHA12024.1 MAG: hypothetical protein A3I44_02295 [Candidatus Sungbacteria bacterium RIFCSPLOWO2_02_FULL_51_17]